LGILFYQADENLNYQHVFLLALPLLNAGRQ